ncbi:sensor histidine kinase [Phytoactinopolyspora limicola]|uniref:sensor histidine kinase n=1 Tax=Phytoactinopolyspora limicola TaxID=2715536 RepID=UPI00140C9815|nr:histidine kinase [Phytoactinopolyspora limicola]
MATTSSSNRPHPELPSLLPAFLTADRAAGPQHGRSARDWLVDVLCTLIAVAVGLVSVVERVNADDGFTTFRAVDVAVGVLGVVALWFRRRWPVHLAVAATAVSVFAASIGGAQLILIFTVAVHRPYPPAVAIAAANILVGGVHFWLFPSPNESWTVSMVFSALVIVIAAVWGMFIRARRQLLVSLRERARQAEAEAHLRVDQARQRERQRIAREMHDVLAHRLSLLSVHANALIHRRDASRHDIEQVSDVIRESAHQALRDLREVIGVLRAPTGHSPDEVGSDLDDLPALLDDSRRAGASVTFDDWRDGDQPLPTAVSRCAYRVVQEGLTNARKHAAGAAVAVALAGSAGGVLTVHVRNGPPAGPVGPQASIPGSSTGLVGLAERTALAGGALSYGPTSDLGFTLTAELPWPE